MEFNEYMIKRNKGAKEILLSVLLYFAATVVALFLLIMFLGKAGSFGGILMLAVVGVYFGAFKLSSRMNKEFEYIITGDSLDIDVIMNATARKRLVTFSVEELEVLASVKDTAYNARLNEQFDKTLDATSGRRDANVYFAVIDKNSKILLKFEPTYTMLTNLRKYSPSKIHIYD